MIIPEHRTEYFIEPFYGTADNGLCLLSYLKNTYKNVCVIIPKLKNKNRELLQTDISLRWSEEDKDLLVPDGYWELFSKTCFKSKRFIIIPFGFSCSTGYGHANFLIYDKIERSLERFDPYGLSPRICLRYPVDKKIKSLFIHNMGKNFIRKYYKPLDYLNKVGVQQLQEKENNTDYRDSPEGYCKSWCSLYAELRILNSSLSRSMVIQEFVKAIGKGNLTSFIRDYSQYVAHKCKRR